jgi:sigma-54 dependent transcriptional regulator, acetoin dehydrogenase operon transcriptional activator AcoR
MTLRTTADAGTPRQLFFTTHEQRVALAREMFFEDGARPSGLVTEAVIQSWVRCVAARNTPTDAIAFNPVTSSRLHTTLGRNAQLLQVAGVELASMEAALSGTACRVLLTDADGVIVHATQNPLASQEPVLRLAARVGVNVSEAAVGTTAPGIVVRTGQACSVTGAEHFYQCNQALHCAAAPIRDVHGRLAGVLDLSVEARRFGFDAASVVGLYATSIENRLLQTQALEQLVVQFQASASLLGTPLEALAGVDGHGRVVWLNGVGTRLVGLPHDASCFEVQDVLGVTLTELLHASGTARAEPLHLPSGLRVWMRVTRRAHDGVDFRHAVALSPRTPALNHAVPGEVSAATADHPAESPEPVSAATDATLGGHSRRLIESTLAEHGGNIAGAARTLGVSRGTLYRRLARWKAAADA